jgi:hypothetical protein
MQNDMGKKPNTFASLWLIFWIAPWIPIKHLLFKINIWLCNRAHSAQIKHLRRAMTLIKAKQDLENINQAFNLYLVISETSNKELKLSGFFAETPEQYNQELAAVPGEKFVAMSMHELRIKILENFMMRRFQNYRAKELAKNGGYYVH